MATLVPESHQALHAIAEEVPREDIGSARIQKIIRDMRAVLHSYKGGEFTGVAIAAPQIGVPLRIFLIEDTGPDKKDAHADAPRLPTLVAINPRLVKLSKKKRLMNEGCLSVDDSYGAVLRSTHATLRAYDERGISYQRGASGFLPQLLQPQ